MATKPIRMSTLKQIIQLKKQGAGIKTIARSLGISKNTVKKYLRLLESEATLNATSPMASEQELVAWLSRPRSATQDRYEHFQTLLPYLEKELQKTGVTRQLLWQEYKQQHPQGYNHTQFCHYLRIWNQSYEVSMVQNQKAGDKLYIDFAGKKLEVVDPASGEATLVEVFIAVLGASQYTYAEAIRSQTKADFLRALENALYYFEGVPNAIVPDNLKAAVTKASPYEPLLNETLEDFAHHYDTVILPTRSRKPQDKALVERTVTLIYQRVYARLRNDVFLSLCSLNQAISELMPHLNEQCFQDRDYSRADRFSELDKPALRPLPAHRYELRFYATVTVLKNYHVFLKEDSHYYSVPYRYVKKKVKTVRRAIAYTNSWVEVYYQYERIAAHPRTRHKYQYSTQKNHMPSTHQFVSDWNPEKFIRWAARIAPSVEEYISKVLASKAHPEQGYKSCIGILNLEKKVGKDRLIAACQRGLAFQSYGYQVIKNILNRQLDQIEEPPIVSYRPPEHENIRGGTYYQ